MRDCFDGRLRRQFSDLPQNRKRNQVLRIAPIVPERVLVEIALQVALAYRVVHTANSSLYQTPRSFDSLSVNLTTRSGDTGFLAVADAAGGPALRSLQSWGPRTLAHSAFVYLPISDSACICSQEKTGTSNFRWHRRRAPHAVPAAVTPSPNSPPWPTILPSPGSNYAFLSEIP